MSAATAMPPPRGLETDLRRSASIRTISGDDFKRRFKRLAELEGEVQRLRAGREPGQPCDEDEALALARAKEARDEIVALLGLTAGAGI